MSEKKGAGSKDMPKKPDAFTNKANGTMDYLSKQDQMASKDASKLKSGKYPNGRYGE
jgi:hypothetical protein